MFGVTPRHSWDDPEQVKKYIQWLEDRIAINNKEDWYSVSFPQLNNYKGRYIQFDIFRPISFLF